jgi:DNA-binding NarL/FixJ family response regulator
MASPLKTPTRVLIADDHPIVRERLITELHPDIAVLDISMPVMDGLEVARRVRQQALLTDLVLLTMYRDPEYFNAAMDLGVRGYLVKESVSADFLSCLKAVTAGEHYISPIIAHLLVERKKGAATSGSLPLREQLTLAEISVLRLVAENKANKEIAETLFVSVRTVENHRARICQKLGIKGHNKLLQFALENRGRF